MDKRNDKKYVDPVVDQQIVKEKKGKGLWWLLLAIIIILLAIWFSTQKSHRTSDESQPATAQTTTQPAVENNTSSATDSSALDKLRAYYSGDRSQDSQWIDLDEVSFATGSATPQINDTSSMDQVAQLIAQHPDNPIVISGFTDDTGSANINQPLSDQRANAIKTWLTQHNVDQSHITIQGQGADHAVADNNTAQGRDQNRRVAIQVKSAQ